MSRVYCHKKWILHISFDVNISINTGSRLPCCLCSDRAGCPELSHLPPSLARPLRTSCCPAVGPLDAGSSRPWPELSEGLASDHSFTHDHQLTRPTHSPSHHPGAPQCVQDPTRKSGSCPWPAERRECCLILILFSSYKYAVFIGLYNSHTYMFGKQS